MPQPRSVKLELGLLLRQSHQRAAAGLNNALLPLGLTGRHFGVMLLLRREGVSSQRDLIRQTGSDKAGMVRTVADLEELGYLSRNVSRNDKRLVDLTLTGSGLKAFDAARRLASEAADGLFGSFAPDELDTLQALLTRFVTQPASTGGVAD